MAKLLLVRGLPGSGRWKMKEYSETHQQGHISLENMNLIFDNIVHGENGSFLDGDLGIQISNDGRVWVCINGIAFLRFKPERKHNAI